MRIIAISLLLILVGCVYAPQPLEKRNSSLTQGNVQMNLKVGKTTKAEVLEIFGSPNVCAEPDRPAERQATTKEEAPQWRRRGAGHDEGGGVLQTCHSVARRAGVVPRRWPRAVRPAVDLQR